MTMATSGKASELLAYLAGVVDSDGWIGIDKSPINARRKSPRYQPAVVVTNCSVPMMELFKREFAGSIMLRKQVLAHHKPTYRWKVCNRMAAEICRQIIPYLLVKRAQAELVIEMMDATARYLESRVGHKLLSTDTLERRESIYQRFRGLNDERGHPQRLSEATPQKVTFIEEWTPKTWSFSLFADEGEAIVR